MLNKTPAPRKWLHLRQEDKYPGVLTAKDAPPSGHGEVQPERMGRWARARALLLLETE